MCIKEQRYANKYNLWWYYTENELQICTDELSTNAQHILAEQNFVYSIGNLSVGSLWLTRKLQNFSPASLYTDHLVCECTEYPLKPKSSDTLMYEFYICMKHNTCMNGK